jgi:hypothetical protein
MPTVYINCYPTSSSSNHQTARDLFFDKKLADSSLESYGVTYELETTITLDDIHVVPHTTKLYVVMRIPQNKYVMTQPIDLYTDIKKAKAKYLDYEYKKKNYRINTVHVIL